MKAWEGRQVQQATLKHIPSVLTMPKLCCSLQPICKPWRLVSLPRPINQRVCGRSIAGLGVSNMEPSSGKRSSMFDLFPVFPGRYPQLDVRGCDSGHRSRSSSSSHRRRGAESGGPLEIEWHCFVSVSGFLARPGWWNKEGFMRDKRPVFYVMRSS